MIVFATRLFDSLDDEVEPAWGLVARVAADGELLLTRTLARRGDLPARRAGRRWLLLRDSLAAAVAPLDDPAARRPNRDAK